MTIDLKLQRVVELTSLVFTVASDPNASNRIDADEFGKFDAITIGTLESTLTGTAITVEVLLDASADETADASWSTLQSPAGTDIEIAAGKAVTIKPPCALALRLKSNDDEASDRTFQVTGRMSRVAGA